MGDEELSRGAGRSNPRGEIDGGADVIACAVEDCAMVGADMQCRKLGLGVDETIHREPEFESVYWKRERQHECIPDLLDDAASVPNCTATDRDPEPVQHIGSSVITHCCGERGETDQVDKQYGGLFLTRCCGGWGGLLGQMA